MKIGFFTDSYRPRIDGVVKSVDLYKEALEKLGHQVYIFAPKTFSFKKSAGQDTNIFRFNSVKSVIVPNYPLAIPISARNYYHLAKLNLDIIHLHTPFTLGVLGIMAARIESKPAVMTCHTHYTEYISHYFLKGKVLTPEMTRRYCSYITNQTDLVISPSEKFKHILEKEGVKRKIIVLPTGLKLQDFQKIKKGYFRRRYFLGGKKILLFVGRLGSEKNVQFLIKAMRYLRDCRNDMVLAIVGEGKYKKNLIALTRRMKLQHQVLFTGFLLGKRLSYAYADADCFAFASKTDTQGLVLLEACAHGLPIVMLADGGLTSAVQDGKNGFIVPKDNPQIFAEKIKELFNNNDIYRDFCLKSRGIASELDIEQQAKKLVMLYKDAIQRKSPNSRRSSSA